MSDVVEMVIKAKDLPDAARARLNVDPEKECQVKITVVDQSVLNKRLQVLDEISETSRDIGDGLDLTNIVRKNRETMEKHNR